MVKVTLEDMLEAGLHFGHQTFRWNPKMREYIFRAQDGIHIIDLTITEQKLKVALDFVAQIAKEGKLLLLVGTKRQAAPIITEQAKANNLAFVTNKWPGGLLTNFKTIKKRISYLKKIRDKVATKDFADMTKKEIGLLEKELMHLEESFGGVDKLTKLPGAIFVVDVLQEKTAIKEAIKLGIPIIAMVDTNGDPDNIEYVIPANDDAKSGILLIVKSLAEQFNDNYKEAIAVAQEGDDSKKDSINALSKKIDNVSDKNKSSKSKNEKKTKKPKEIK